MIKLVYGSLSQIIAFSHDGNMRAPSNRIDQIKQGFFNYTLFEKCNLMRLLKTSHALKSSDSVQLNLSVAKIASQLKQMKNAKNSVRQMATPQRLSPLMI